jgi:sulfatase modifying factor 1
MNKSSIFFIVVFIGIIGGALWYFFKPVTIEPNKKKIRVNELLENFVTIEGGNFVMGAPDSIGAADEVQHSAYVSTFQMQTTEVTQELYELVMGNNPSNNKAWKDMPVTSVSWNDCQDFLYELFVLTGRVYRLPTEAEWEYAAIGGARSRGYLYAGSNKLEEVGWLSSNSGNSIHVVGEKRPNELGLYDMSGNVWEWCSDWYGPYRLDAKGSANSKGPDNGEKRVFRGGGYSSYVCRNTQRYSQLSDKEYTDVGFRLVLSVFR